MEESKMNKFSVQTDKQSQRFSSLSRARLSQKTGLRQAEETWLNFDNSVSGPKGKCQPSLDSAVSTLEKKRYLKYC